MQIGVDTARAVETKRAFIFDLDEISATALQFMLADELEVNVYTSLAEARTQGSSRGLDVILLGASVVEAQTPAVVGQLKAEWPGVPIIVFGHADDPAVQAALGQGARTSITRPFKVEAVRQRVNAHIGRRAVLSVPVVVQG